MSEKGERKVERKWYFGVFGKRRKWERKLVGSTPRPTRMQYLKFRKKTWEKTEGQKVPPRETILMLTFILPFSFSSFLVVVVIDHLSFFLLFVFICYFLLFFFHPFFLICFSPHFIWIFVLFFYFFNEVHIHTLFFNKNIISFIIFI